MSYVLAPGYCLENVQGVAQREETEAELNRLPQLRKQIENLGRTGQLEFAGRSAVDQREVQLNRSAEVPSEHSAEY